jgi:glycosyltransferase involved in cell wall biosynthesis
MKKFAFISLGLPPSQSGQSVVVYHLLKAFDPATYCLITLKNFHQYNRLGNCSDRLPASHHFVHPDYQFVRVFINTASKLRLKFLLTLLLRFRIFQYKRVIRKENCTAVVGCTGDLLDPPAAFLASRALNLPFVLYAFDYYSCQWTDPVLRLFADEHEKAILKGAAQIIVPNECLQKVYRERYGVTTTVIHNPFDSTEYNKNIHEGSLRKDPAGKKIVYTGAVYEAHYSAFRNLIDAIKLTQIPGLMLHIYTPQSDSHLETNGITGPVVIHKHLPNSEMPDIQRGADLLFLPLAFNSKYPDIIRTSAPGKIAEYLAAGTPVLVHAPKDSFVAWFFAQNQCGLVVSDDDPLPLSLAIKRLLSDDRLYQDITMHAKLLATTEFDSQYAREKFSALLTGLE